MVLVCLVVLSQPVSAQGDTQLLVSPQTLSVPVGTDILIELGVIDGENINAFDVTINYDADILSLDTWEYGDYLSNLAVVSQTNQPGLLRLAATQLATPAVSGDGVLLRLTFNTLSAGQSPITIVEADFADSQGSMIEPVTFDGAVNVISTATFTGTPTPTRTGTGVTSSTPTATNTPFPTTAQTTPAPVQVTATPSTGPGQTTSTQELTEEVKSSPTTSALSPTQSAAVTTPGMEGTDQSALAAGTGEGNGLETHSQDVTTSGEPSPEREPDQGQFLRWLLWGLLIAIMLAVAVMGVIFYRRKNNKEQDLL